MQQKEEIWNSNSMKANKDLAAKRMFWAPIFFGCNTYFIPFSPEEALFNDHWFVIKLPSFTIDLQLVLFCLDFVALLAYRKGMAY